MLRHFSSWKTWIMEVVLPTYIRNIITHYIYRIIFWTSRTYFMSLFRLAQQNALRKFYEIGLYLPLEPITSYLSHHFFKLLGNERAFIIGISSPIQYTFLQLTSSFKDTYFALFYKNFWTMVECRCSRYHRTDGFSCTFVTDRSYEMLLF